MVTLVIHSSLKPYFNNEKLLTTNCKDYYDLISFLVNSFPNFANILKKIKCNLDVDFFLLDKNKKRIDLKDIQVNKKLKDNTYYLVPSIVGGGGGKMQIALGILIIAVAIIAAPASGGASLGMLTPIFTVGTYTFTYMSLAMIGVNLVLGGVMAMMQGAGGGGQQRRTLRDDGTRTENSLFASTMNTTQSGIPVGINYGMTRTGGQFISGYVKTLNHGKGDTINVSGEFTS